MVKAFTFDFYVFVVLLTRSLYDGKEKAFYVDGFCDRLRSAVFPSRFAWSLLRFNYILPISKITARRRNVQLRC